MISISLILLLAIFQLNLNCFSTQITPIELLGEDVFRTETQPLIVEKEGIDRNGNHFYEKDVIIDTDLKKFPKVTPTQITELVRKENQLYLERLNKMREQALKRRMAAIAHAQLSSYMGHAAPLVVASLLPTDKEIAEAKQNGRATSNEELFGWIKPVSESRSTFEIEMPSSSSSSSPDAENDKPKRDRFEIDSYDEEPLTSSSSDEEVSKFQRQNQEVRKQEKEYLDKLSSEKSEENDLSNKIEAAFSQEMESKKSETQYKKKPVPSESSSESIEIVDRSYIAVELNKHVESQDVEKLTKSITDVIGFMPRDWLKYVELKDNLVFIKLDKDINSDDLIQQINNKKDEIYKLTGLKIVSCGLGHDDHYVLNSKLIDTNSENFLLVTIIICATVAAVLLTLIIVFLIRRRSLLRERLSNDVLSGLNKKPLNDEERLINDSFQTAPKSWKSFWPFRSSVADQSEISSSSNNYQELCRQRMQGKGSPTAVSNESASIVPSSSNNNTSNNNNAQPSRVTSSSDNKTESTRSSTSSWSEEPIQTVNMDITTGHVILAYIEEYLNDKNRLTKEWNDLCEYEADINKTESAQLPHNMTKNRYSNILAYDHSRVKLDDNNDSDYINANFITDDDPKNPAYIATQGPLIHTTCDFWKMIWEQGSVVIVSLCRTVEYGSLKCNQYWPANGCEVYDKFEVHLVSEHVWCDDYLVRSFYLKNLETNQSRTVTQFHFLTWPETGLPPNIKSLLDFRRKVNKSYKSKASPIIVHCNDGVGRTGTYIMIDMVLNKIIKGAKEIDLAAIVEFLRDQRPSMIKSKAQFEFSFAVITEEVQNMLKAIAQN